MEATDVRCAGCGFAQPSTLTCRSCGASIDNPVTPETISELENDPIHRIQFHGYNRSLLEIQVVNVFLILITLGVYYFWAKARVRNYLLSKIELEGDRFAYHGTGKEQLIGFLKAGLLFGGLSLFFKLVPFLPMGQRPKIVLFALGYIIFFGFIAVARIGARRYRLSRVSWRNIRFSFRGRVGRFVKIFLTGFLLNILTLGLNYPLFRYKQDVYMISHSYFGNRHFSFDGNVKDIYKIYFQSSLFFIAYFLVMFPLLWLLGLILVALSQWFSPTIVGIVGFLGGAVLLTSTFSLPWSFLVTEQQQYFWSHVSFGEARFKLEVTFGSFLRMKLGNILLFVFTLGLAWPWIAARNIQFLADHLTLEGAFNLETIQQEAQISFPFGDEFDTLLDLDLGSSIG